MCVDGGLLQDSHVTVIVHFRSVFVGEAAFGPVTWTCRVVIWMGMRCVSVCVSCLRRTMDVLTLIALTLILSSSSVNWSHCLFCSVRGGDVRFQPGSFHASSHRILELVPVHVMVWFKLVLNSLDLKKKSYRCTLPILLVFSIWSVLRAEFNTCDVSLYVSSKPHPSLILHWAGFIFVLNVKESLRINSKMYSFKKVVAECLKLSN